MHQCKTCEQIDPAKPFYVPGENDCYEDCRNTTATAFYVEGTHKCLERCPPGLFHNDTDNLCADACRGDKPYREKGEFVCYANCEHTEHDWRFFIRGSYVCYARCLDTETHLYFNLGAHACLRQCLPGAPFRLPDAPECRTACPAGAEYHEWNGTVCYGRCEDTPHKYYFHTKTGRECKPACTTDAWFHAHDDVVCAESCAALELPYAAPGSDACFARCEDNPDAYYHLRGTTACLPRCPTGTFHEAADGECVQTCAAGEYFVPGDPLCRPACPDTAPYHASRSFECRASCPPGSAREFDGDVCYASCAVSEKGYRFSTAAGGLCYPNCTAAGLGFWRFGSTTCLERCPAETFREGDGPVCYQCCNQTENSPYSVAPEWRCVADCADTDYPFRLAGGDECRADCGELFFDRGSLECISGCAEGRFHAKDGHECDSQCPEGYEYRYDGDQVCYEECPERHIVEGRRCVKACPTSHPLEVEETRECVAGCPKPLKQSGGRCVSKCEPAQYLVAETEECEGECPGDTVTEAGRRICYRDCGQTLSGWEFLVPEKRACYESCAASGTHPFRLPDTT